MPSLTEAQLKMLPEMSGLLQVRYRILNMVQMLGPIGRRALADSLSLAEREVRKETDLMREQGLIAANRTGMSISEAGIQILDVLKPLVYEWSGITDLERQLQKHLRVKRMTIVDGNVDQEPSVKAMMGVEAANLLKREAKQGDIIAVTGGSTVAAVGEQLSTASKIRGATFIAARGGMGFDVKMQANTIAAEFANNTGNEYRTLYLPEHLSEAAYNAMIHEPIVKDMLDLYDRTDIVVHGVGSADEMAWRRNSTSDEVDKLREHGAIGEAFGYYFDETGKAVQRIRTVGLQLEQVKKCPTVIALAGGASKAKAILAYFTNAPEQTNFITDLSAAQEMLKIIREEI